MQRLLKLKFTLTSMCFRSATPQSIFESQISFSSFYTLSRMSCPDTSSLWWSAFCVICNAKCFHHWQLSIFVSIKINVKHQLKYLQLPPQPLTTGYQGNACCSFFFSVCRLRKMGTCWAHAFMQWEYCVGLFSSGHFIYSHKWLIRLSMRPSPLRNQAKSKKLSGRAWQDGDCINQFL